MKPESRIQRPLGFALLLFFALSPLLSAAPESPLQASLRELEAELAALRAQLSDAQAKAELSRQERASKLEALAASILRDELASAALSEDLEALEKQHRELEAQRKSAEAERAQLASATARLCQSMSLRAREQPGGLPRSDGLEAIISGLQGPQPKLDGEAARALSAAYKESLSEAESLRIQRATLHSASGKLEELELLQLGAILCAYRSADGRIGLALASPREARGWRWSEDLPEQVRSALIALFEGKGASIFVDLTGSLRPEDLKSKEHWQDRLKSGGWVMIPLALLALIGTLLVAERALALLLLSRGSRAGASAAAALRAGSWREAQRALETASGFVPSILAPLLRLQDSDAATRESAIQAALIDQAPKLQSRLGAISVLAAIAPLLGLLGTVTGIIQTFGVIQRFGSANPGLMAGGISEALITTAAGLSIAIPLLLGHSVLAAWADRILAEGERQAALALQVLLELDSKPALTTAPTKISSEPPSSAAAEPAP